MNPILKWAGGKRKLVPQLIDLMPEEYGRYHEPMVGGGALFFGLKLAGNGHSIGDMNRQLITLYRILKQCPLEVWTELSELMAGYSHANDQKQFYYDTRNRFNTITGHNSTIAAMMIFLNKTCFNGLWRTNKNGLMNVSWNKNKAPAFPDLEDLMEASRYLQHADIVTGDFADIVSRVSPGDFVYLDPPYVPENDGSFTAYTPDAFSGGDRRLLSVVEQLTGMDVYCMISNRANAAAKNLFAGLNIHEVMSTSSINRNGNGRGPLKEIVITNYLQGEPVAAGRKEAI